MISRACSSNSPSTRSSWFLGLASFCFGYPLFLDFLLPPSKTWRLLLTEPRDLPLFLEVLDWLRRSPASKCRMVFLVLSPERAAYGCWSISGWRSASSSASSVVAYWSALRQPGVVPVSSWSWPLACSSGPWARACGGAWFRVLWDILRCSESLSCFLCDFLDFLEARESTDGLSVRYSGGRIASSELTTPSCPKSISPITTA